MAFLPLVILVVGLVVSSVHILNEYERGVLFFLGRYSGVRGPGIVVVIPGVQKIVRLSLRTLVLDVPPQDVITKDNVSVKVNAVVYFRVIYPDKAVLEVENYLFATSQLAQTTLRSVVGQVELDDLLSNRDKVNQQLQHILDQHAGSWGIKVSNVEVKNVDLPQEMLRAIAKQAEAERERRAKIIHAEGEFQASEKLGAAAEVISRNPGAMQLRFLQTLVQVAGDKSSTILFPLPIEFFETFLKKKN
ncbi:MAG: slipin family protein [Elusimicrobia bacterium]|nr:slipin family protein [Elusimicrobiota bacterium]